jgi:hypothetical protein
MHNNIEAWNPSFSDIAFEQLTEENLLWKKYEHKGK